MRALDLCHLLVDAYASAEPHVRAQPALMMPGFLRDDNVALLSPKSFSAGSQLLEAQGAGGYVYIEHVLSMYCKWYAGAVYI